MDFHWVKMAVTLFVTHLHMFLDILKFTAENKKKCLGKTVLKCGLRFKDKVAYVSTKLLLDKNAKTENNKNQKTMKTFTIFGGF